MKPRNISCCDRSHDFTFLLSSQINDAKLYSLPNISRVTELNDRVFIEIGI